MTAHLVFDAALYASALPTPSINGAPVDQGPPRRSRTFPSIKGWPVDQGLARRSRAGPSIKGWPVDQGRTVVL
ncbi:hypothetical protein [Phytohabitans rumicis]|uniref:hypothetical protein n=1 Tax=Phytohabitans rumicis TaxID=1076125 RepID=UPI0015659EB0|nr:hypothetical protein [Phytohabitans rumicis]